MLSDFMDQYCVGEVMLSEVYIYLDDVPPFVRQNSEVMSTPRSLEHTMEEGEGERGDRRWEDTVRDVSPLSSGYERRYQGCREVRRRL